MFAVIKTGGKQYKVAPNDVIKIEMLPGEAGDTIEFTDVLMMGKGDSVKIGSPWVTPAHVAGTIVDQIRDDKVIIFKKNRRHNYRRKNGHRQYLTVVRITDISEEKSKGTPKKVEAAKPAPKAAPQKVEKAEAAKPVKAEKKAAPKPAPKAEPKAKKPAEKKVAKPTKATKK
jgi:large subunit ribosomal protein L21